MRCRNQLELGVVLLLLATLSSHAEAQSEGRYAIRSSTIDGGGTTTSSGGSYALAGTIGQPDAGVLEGGTYTLGGGFWSVGRLHVVQSLSSLAAEALVLLLCLSFTARAVRRRKFRGAPR